MQDANFDGVSGVRAQRHRRGEAEQEKCFFQERQLFHIDFVECGFSSVSGYRSAFWFLSGDTPSLVAAMLTSAFEHPMCHTKNIQAANRLFKGFRYEVV